MRIITRKSVDEYVKEILPKVSLSLGQPLEFRVSEIQNSNYSLYKDNGNNWEAWLYSNKSIDGDLLEEILDKELELNKENGLSSSMVTSWFNDEELDWNRCCVTIIPSEGYILIEGESK